MIKSHLKEINSDWHPDIEYLFYVSKSGFSDSFTEFHVLGLLLYVGLSILFKEAWCKWTKKHDTSSLFFLLFFGFYPALFVYGEWKEFVVLALPALVVYLGLRARRMRRGQLVRLRHGRV